VYEKDASGDRRALAVDQKAFEKIKGDDKQMCAGMTLSVVYPSRLVVVRSPGGTWEVVS
jgi:hypothetical protein